MPRAQHDREREREENEQDEEGDGDAEAAAGLGGVRGRQRGWRLGGLTATVTGEHVFLVDTERARIGAQEAADEHVGREVAVIVVFQLMQNADGDARGLSELRDRNLPQLSFPLQVASQ